MFPHLSLTLHPPLLLHHLFSVGQHWPHPLLPSRVLHSVLLTIQWTKRVQYMVYVEWFGHWDQHRLHHQCEVAEFLINTKHCNISSLSCKIKNYKVLNEFTLWFHNLLSRTDISGSTIESLLWSCLSIEILMPGEPFPHVVFSRSYVAPSMGLQKYQFQHHRTTGRHQNLKSRELLFHRSNHLSAT